jgi:hypothetical protein
VFRDLQGVGQDRLTVDLIISTQTGQRNLANLRFNLEDLLIIGLSLQPSTVKPSDKTLDIVRKGPIRTFMSKNSWQRFNS